MPSNRAKDRAPTLTPRKKRNEANTGSTTTTQAPQQDGNAKSYNADLSVAGNQVQTSHPAGLCLHNPIAQVVLHKRWTTLTQQQCIMRSQMGNIKTSLPVYRHHPRTLYQQELPPPPKPQIKRFYRLVEPKPHHHQPSESLHQQDRHKHIPHRINHIGR